MPSPSPTPSRRCWPTIPTPTCSKLRNDVRAAASTAYLVATAEGFTVIVGMRDWVAELDRLGRTPEQNRTLLAGITT